MNPNHEMQQGSMQQTGATQQAKETVGRLSEEAREKTGEIAQQARDTGMEYAQQQKSRATESMGVVAGALRQTGQQLRGQDQAAFGQMAERAAEKIERFSTDIQNKNVNELLTEAENFARRDPHLFLGGAVVLGLLASRFLKSSANRRRQEQMPQYGQYGQQYNQYAPTGGSRVYTANQQSQYGRGSHSTSYGGTYSEAGESTYTSSTSSEPTFPAGGATPSSTTHPSSTTRRPDPGAPRRTDE